MSSFPSDETHTPATNAPSTIRITDCFSRKEECFPNNTDSPIKTNNVVIRFSTLYIRLSLVIFRENAMMTYPYIGMLSPSKALRAIPTFREYKRAIGNN